MFQSLTASTKFGSRSNATSRWPELWGRQNSRRLSLWCFHVNCNDLQFNLLSPLFTAVVASTIQLIIIFPGFEVVRTLQPCCNYNSLFYRGTRFINNCKFPNYLLLGAWGYRDNESKVFLKGNDFWILCTERNFLVLHGTVSRCPIDFIHTVVFSWNVM